MEFIDLLFYTVIGTIISSFLALIPALHVYNLVGLFLILLTSIGGWIEPFQIAALMIGMIVGYSIISIVPSTFFGAADESMSYIILPGTQWVDQGKGYEGVFITAFGGVIGIIFFIALTPLLFIALPVVRTITSPHMFWILGAIISYLLISEWPKGISQYKSVWANLWDGWSSLTAGLATFFLSGILGFIVLSRTLVPLDMAFQGIMPVFVGLFAIPWLITNIINIGEIPAQHCARSSEVDASVIIRGGFSGLLGGMFAAVFPIVTAGVGATLAGHATAQRDSRIFVFSYGAAKVVYFVGAFLIFFIPGLNLTRGGLAWMLTPIFQPYNIQDYAVAVSLTLVSAGLAFFLTLFWSRIAIKMVKTINYRYISWVTLLAILILIYSLTGFGGLFILWVSTGIGLLPVLYHSRRINCMGALLFPVCLNMAGFGNAVAEFLGLM